MSDIFHVLSNAKLMHIFSSLV